MKEYIIIKDINSTNLENKVINKLKEGYICQGGVSSIRDSYIQAMILIKK
jgi:hypothetical protein